MEQKDPDRDIYIIMKYNMLQNSGEKILLRMILDELYAKKSKLTSTSYISEHQFQ